MDTNTLEIIGFCFGIVLSLIGFLINRNLSHFDVTIKMLVMDVKALQLQITSTSQLNTFMDRRLHDLERECRVFRRSFSNIDQIIARRLGVLVPQPDPDAENPTT